MSLKSLPTAPGIFLLFLGGMLGFYSLQVSGQAPTPAPFVDAAEQRNVMISELKEIHALLKEQNGLLRQMVPKTNGREATKK